ncbi:katanin p60 ATPase-containing subunit A-like 2 isoform X3 [Ruditapes philippinarum]|uniref:katanin p60 ATPase-containing subunit A-like 2 isoform X3 n=1 Tax=Ruditapes philippinarum TaxID=129788 RepID=UPI00295C263E|nr:katanin p60 ATPase-containing subunit A-like 2 isoform X3 [Ruditapes philippinarum]
MAELSYQSIRTANQAREADELKTETRKKNILILVLNYLNEEGYLDSGQALARETNIDVSKFEVCDNIDLDTIVMEYESYYYVKFAKYPKICKKLTQSGHPTGDRRTKMNRANSMRHSASSSAILLHRLATSCHVCRDFCLLSNRARGAHQYLFMFFY